jgi:hypothetical protein
VFERCRRSDPSGIEHVLDANGNAMQRTAPPARRDFEFRRLGVRECPVREHGNESIHGWLKGFNSR